MTSFATIRRLSYLSRMKRTEASIKIIGEERRASARRSFKNPLERKVGSRSARAERGRKGYEEDEDEARRGEGEGGEIKEKRKRLVRVQERPEANWCVPVVWRAGQNLVAEGKTERSGRMGTSPAVNWFTRPLLRISCPADLLSKWPLLHKSRNVHFEFPPNPTFQREIYDSPSRILPSRSKCCSDSFLVFSRSNIYIEFFDSFYLFLKNVFGFK